MTRQEPTIAVEPTQPSITEIKPTDIERVAATPVPPTPLSGGPVAGTTAKATPPVKSKAPEKAAGAPLPVEQPPKVEPPVAVAKAPEPSLDLAGLTARLRETRAVGVMTKLALKNQVDDLLKLFRVHYQGGQKSSVATLRPPYDMLVLKVLAVVQDGDPALARAIAGSREAIWAVLADREKFNSVV